MHQWHRREYSWMCVRALRARHNSIDDLHYMYILLSILNLINKKHFNFFTLFMLSFAFLTKGDSNFLLVLSFETRAIISFEFSNSDTYRHRQH